MGTFSIIIQYLLNIESVIIYIGIIGLFGVLELFFIKERKYAEKIFPVFLLIVAIVLTVNLKTESYNAMKRVDVIHDQKIIGEQLVLLDNDNRLEALGKFITNEDDYSKYIDVKIIDGDLTINEKVSKYRDAIIKSMKAHKIKYDSFTGKSLSYNELEKMSMCENENESFLNKSRILLGVLISLPGLLTSGMYIYFYFRRKRKNMLKRIKLEDL